MQTLFRFGLLLVLMQLVVPSKASFATDCAPEHYTAPGPFKNDPLLWGRTDSGVIVDAFVSLLGIGGKTLQISHGVDLSSNNSVDYEQIAKCGSNFTIVRLDNSFPNHSKGFSSWKVPVFAYFFFGIDKSYRQYRLYRKATAQDIAKLSDKFKEIGIAAGHRFLNRAKKMGLMGAEFDGGSIVPGLSGPIVALDIEQKLDRERLSTEKDRRAYGRLYAKAVCQWIQTTTQAIPNLNVILYTTPSVYYEYFDKVDEEENNCLHGLPVWVARTTSDGGDAVRVLDPDEKDPPYVDMAARRLCRVPAGNRCIIHQYSHRGIFGALGEPDGKGIPPHIDIDRLFPIKIVRDSVGIQIVRDEADF